MINASGNKTLQTASIDFAILKILKLKIPFYLLSTEISVFLSLQINSSIWMSVSHH